MGVLSEVADRIIADLLREKEARIAKLEEVLRECVHQIECVMDYYTIHPIDRPKLVYTLRQAREVLGDA